MTQTQRSHDRADEISVNLFEIARDCGDPEILLQAHHTAWPLRWARGLLVEATHHIDAGLALYDETRHGGHGYIYLGHDPELALSAFEQLCTRCLGTRQDRFPLKPTPLLCHDDWRIRHRWPKLSCMFAIPASGMAGLCDTLSLLNG